MTNEKFQKIISDIRYDVAILKVYITNCNLSKSRKSSINLCLDDILLKVSECANYEK